MDDPKLTVVQEGVAEECNLATLRHHITPNELYFVRSRYPTPKIQREQWRLVVGGLVENPLRLSYEELLAMPQKTFAVTMECAGNGRVHLDPPAPGLQFNEGAIGTAEWTGVPLSHILEMAGVKPSAVEVLMEGADQNPEPNSPEGEVYQRGLALDKAFHPDTLLAIKMNGVELPASHGYPVRAIVPGWYGMASVKWLMNIELISEPFEGHFQKSEYVIKLPDGSAPKPVTKLLVKSYITSPEESDSYDVGPVTVSGVAWSGEGLERVEVSVDNGETWANAALQKAASEYSWSAWSFNWEPNTSGEYVVMARAIDKKGNIQPFEPEWNELGYEINPVHRVSVVIK